MKHINLIIKNSNHSISILDIFHEQVKVNSFISFNACRNNLGELVPCAFPSSAGASVYAYNNYPEIVPFVQEATGGVAAPVDLPAPADIPALENNDLEVPEAPSVVSVKKREAEPQAHG